MSLLDTDMNTQDRSDPRPYNGDKVQNPMAHQTVSTQYNPVGDTSTARIQQIGKSIIANDGATNKAVYGYNPALDKWGFFVADDNVDVMTNTDLSQLIFNSNQNVLKVAQSGTFTLTGGTVAARTMLQRSANIDHNLGYVPMLLAIADDGTGSYVPFPSPRVSSIGIVTGQVGVTTNAIDNYEVYIQDDLVYVIGYFYNGTTGQLVVPDLTVKYFLLQETAV